MSSEPKAMDIKIMGREFRVTSTEEEKAGLLRAVDYLDNKMRDIRDNGKVAGVERIAIMAALNIAHELLTLQGSGGVDLTETKRRMAAMRTTIEAALSKQTELF